MPELTLGKETTFSGFVLNIYELAKMRNSRNSSGGALLASEETQMSGALGDILIASTILTVPMLALSGVLLALIFSNQVQNNPSLFDGGNNTRKSTDDAAYYVDYSATRLITVASWTSTVAPLLPSFIMILISYPIAQRILNNSRTHGTESLPTPYQTSLLLGLYTGSVSSLWPLFKYRSWQSHERLPSIARAAVISLSAASTIG